MHTELDWVLRRKGIDVALTTDAGTPCISDPGFSLLRALREAGLAWSVVPGPSHGGCPAADPCSLISNAGSAGILSWPNPL